MSDCNTTDNLITEYEQRAQPDAPSGSMLFWADRLLQIKQDIEDHELELKRLSNVYDNAEKTLFDMMTATQLQMFKRNGFSFSPSVKTRASIRAEFKDEAIEWLKDSEYAEIVKETVNSNTLTSMVKEWQENGVSGEVEEFFEMLNVYQKQEISIRRGR